MGSRLDDLRNEILQYQNVIVYGAGQNAGPVLSWLDESDEFTDIQKFVAVTKPKKNESFRGYEVYKIDDLSEFRQDALILIAVFKDYFADIDENIQKLGFCHYVHMEDWFVEEAYYNKFWKEDIVDNKILVENFHGLGYGDSPKYIVEELRKRKNDLDIVWIVKPGVAGDVPEGIRTVEIYTSKFFYEVATAKVWISNVRKYQSVRKRAGQFYIQTWHGFALKKIEKDAEEISHGISAPYFDAGKKDSQMIDLLTSSAVFLTKIFRQTFWYDGEIVETGAPRNDLLFGDCGNIVDKVKGYYDIPSDAKVLLYAPTFRSNYKDNPLDVDIMKILQLLENKTGNNWVALIRMHPNISARANLFTYSDKIINATWYSDVMELLPVTDLLITDYSSIMFDFMLTKRPIFLYAKDMERYSSDDRGFYFGYNTLPFPIAKTNEQILSNIENFNEQKYKDGVNEFINRMGFVEDGKAAERIGDIIINYLGR